jgi:hypothetical protein
MRSLRLTAIILACITCVTTSAFAVDGVVLIDQNRALAGSVTPGDAPGFPVTLTLPGSYRLSGNLTVPEGALSGIVIAADGVTLDLNGFQLAGSNGTGGGIVDLGFRRGIVVRNGSVTNFGTGIQLDASSGTEVAQIRAFGNSGLGINPGFHSIVTDNVASGNLVGIFAIGSRVARGNTVFQNSSAGLQVGGGTVIDNTAFLNGTGILVICPANLVANAADENTENIVTLSSGCTRTNNNPTP